MAKKSEPRITVIVAEYDGKKKFAIVQDHTLERPKKDHLGKVIKKDGKVVYETIVKTLPVEYANYRVVLGTRIKTMEVAHFPHTQEGLKKARSVLKKIKK